MNDDIKPAERHVDFIPVHQTPRDIDTDEAETEPSFKTPEQASKDDIETVHLDNDNDKPKGQASKQPNEEGRWAALKQWRPTRKQWVIIGVVAVLLIGSGVTYALTRPKKATPAVANKPKAQILQPVQLTSNLTGLTITSQAINQRPVTGVMIENTDDARPQSGLDQAGVVFEAVAEGGITRFLALFQDTAPSYIGPVRSARPYYVQWCMQFDCDYAHVGGSPDALSDITSWGTHDLNEFYNGNSYQRVSNRTAPHNVYTSMSQLNSLEASKGFGAPTYTPLPRKPDSPDKTPNATSITINPSYADFESTYAYNASGNNYTRSEAGTIQYQVDASGNKTQITPKVVIAMVIPASQGALDASGAYYTDYASVGSGPVDVFQDGTLTVGTWSKASNTAQILLTSSTNQPIKLDAGQTWFVAVSQANQISYQ